MYRITTDPTTPGRVTITCHACRRWSVSVQRGDPRGQDRLIKGHTAECAARVRPEGGEAS